MSVRLACRSFQYPVVIAENMLIEVGKFTFPADFVILKMEEDSKVPLILGRPFLHTANAVIRVKQKQLNLGVGTERMIFNIDSAIKHSYSNNDTCFSIGVIDEILEEDFDALLNKGTMDSNEDYDSESDEEEPKFEKITINIDCKIKISLEEPLTDLKLKPLPDNLEYVFLEEPYFLLVIISSQLSTQNKSKLVFVIKNIKKHLLGKQQTFLPMVVATVGSRGGDEDDEVVATSDEDGGEEIEVVVMAAIDVVGGQNPMTASESDGGRRKKRGNKEDDMCVCLGF
ncbi:reverse transcriptase domain-containing protein [Tanacetum coccineum]